MSAITPSDLLAKVPSRLYIAGRWVDGELGLTEEWLVFASGDPHDAPDFALLDGDVNTEVSTSGGIDRVMSLAVANRTTPLAEAFRPIAAIALGPMSAAITCGAPASAAAMPTMPEPAPRSRTRRPAPWGNRPSNPSLLTAGRTP